MKYKNFVVSDVHSFYTPLITSLNKEGFDVNNRKHRLIVCGDLFDRGKETLEVYNFIKSLPKSRRVLIRGNHEYLLRACLNKTIPDDYDFSNGTIRTICAFIKEPDTEDILDYLCHYEPNRGKIVKFWKKITNRAIFKKLIHWIFETGERVDYYELDNYIFVHSFIPLIPTIKFSGFYYEYDPNRRKNAIQEDYEQASWGCPYTQFDNGYFDEEIKNNKILVCGHWHCSDFHYHYHESDDPFKDFSIYKSNNLIAIDACTARSGQTNVLVIEE